MSALYAILVYLIQTLLSSVLVAMLLRFLLQLVRADFYNPISQFMVKADQSLVMPMRRVIPGYAGVDIASLVLALFLQIAGHCCRLPAQLRRDSAAALVAHRRRARCNRAAGSISISLPCWP